MQGRDDSVHDRVELREYRSEGFSEGCDAPHRVHEVVPQPVPLSGQVRALWSFGATSRGMVPAIVIPAAVRPAARRGCY